MSFNVLHSSCLLSKYKEVHLSLNSSCLSSMLFLWIEIFVLLILDGDTRRDISESAESRPASFRRQFIRVAVWESERENLMAWRTVFVKSRVL